MHVSMHEGGTLGGTLGPAVAGPFYRLHVGRRLTGITVHPDASWPNMWRVHSADGRISDMANLTRAKDAAMVQLSQDRGRGLTRREIAYWRYAGARQRPAADDSSAAAVF